MPRISPFVGLRFDADRVGPLERVTAPPYDAISTDEHHGYLGASAHNVTRLDLGDAPGSEDGERYRRAAGLLAGWRREGILVPTDGPVYLPYEMRFRLGARQRRVRGFVCAVDLEDREGSITPHERTMDAPVEDRLQALRELRANLSCIESLYRGPSETVAEWLDRSMAADPVGAVTDGDGVEHRIWAVDPDPAVAAALADERLMIADGHHRYATALRYRDEMRTEAGPGPWDQVMMLLIDSTLEEPPVLPFHRLVVSGDPPTQGRSVRDLEEVLGSVDDRKLVYGIATKANGGVAHRLAELDGDPPAVCRLHEGPLAGLDEQLRFTPDALAAEQAVRSGEAVAAYFLPATDATTIRAAVERRGRLPQKSTFFWPKPRTGLVLRPFDAAS